MEFEQEFIEKNQLTEDQVAAITPLVSEHVSTLQKEWDGKANENAEGIISGAGKKVIELTGIERDQGEKWAEYLERANGLYFEGTKSTLQTKQKELEDKLKNAKGDEVLKQELADTKEAIKGLKQKEAEYDEWVKNDYKGKYESTSQKLTQMEQRIAFKDNIPTKPENVNKYEWNAKIKEFQTELLNDNNLVFDENDTPWLVDKENEFKKVKLSDAVKQNEEIQNLVKGREQKGLNSKDKKIKIEGLPFEMKENATSQERNTAIKDYLATKYKSKLDDGYAQEFTKLNQIALGLGKKPE